MKVNTVVYTLIALLLPLNDKTRGKEIAENSFRLRGKLKVDEDSLVGNERNLRNPKSFPSCAPRCWDGNNCKLLECEGCFFSCTTGTCRVRQLSCHSYCDSIEDCSKEYCSGCMYCQDDNSQICPIVTFEDKTEMAFSTSSDYWNQWLHSGKPYFHEGAPLFVDINKDNVLDYFNTMHGHDSETADRMELGISKLSSTLDDTYSFEKASARIINTDEVDDREIKIDTHGQVIVDLDGDGYLDVLISNGGGRFYVEPTSTTYDNWLFWGEPSTSNLTGEEITLFKGGRDAAREAGVHMRVGRGRFPYLLDVNSDGLIDLFFTQDRRVSNFLAPGILLINQGNRTWKEDRSMMEFTRTMMVTDADGDGFAEEILINRGFCYPQRDGPGVDETQPELGAYSQEVKRFCNTRPVGTNAVYRYNKSSQQMEEISKSYKNFWAGEFWKNSCCENGSYNGSNDCNAQSIASGDFDWDQKADHVLLYNSKLVFFFSSDRPMGMLPDNPEYIGLTINLPDTCVMGRSVRVIDFDNDGKEEILVSCHNTGTFLLYSRGYAKTDWTLQNGCNHNGALGDISNRSLTTPSLSDMNEFCDLYQETELGIAQRICEKFKRTGRITFSQSAGLAIADFNNDGFLDVASTNSFGYLRLFYNVPTNSNKFIVFKLIGDVNANQANNQYGIGATVILECTNRKGKIRKQFREVSSFQHNTDKFGSKENRLIFGLGMHLTPSKITVKWSNKKNQILNLQGWEFSSSVQPIEIMDRGDWSPFTLENPTLGTLCLSAGEGNEWEQVRATACSKSNENKWILDRRGRLKNQEYPDYCLSPATMDVETNTSLLLQHCYTDAKDASWFFTSHGRIKYSGTNFVIDAGGQSSNKNVYMSPLDINNVGSEVNGQKWKRVG